MARLIWCTILAQTCKGWGIEKEKDPITLPFYHARLPVYSWVSGSVTTNMDQFDSHTM